PRTCLRDPLSQGTRRKLSDQGYIRRNGVYYGTPSPKPLLLRKCKRRPTLPSLLIDSVVLKTIVVVTLVFTLGLMARAAWIRSKVAALQAPKSVIFAAANKELLPKSARRRIVLIGDSRIAQWPMADWPTAWEVINRGIAEETTTQLIQRFDA